MTGSPCNLQCVVEVEGHGEGGECCVVVVVIAGDVVVSQYDYDVGQHLYA